MTQEELADNYENSLMQGNRLDFSDRLLNQINFDNFSEFSYSKFDRSDLSGCKLDNSDFRFSDFRGANLSNASVKDCTFDGADFSGAKLQGVDFSEAILTGVTGDRKYVKSLHINAGLPVAYTFDYLWIACTKISIDSLSRDARSLGYSHNLESIPSEVLEFSKIYGNHPSWNASHPNFIKRLITEIDPAINPNIV